MARILIATSLAPEKEYTLDFLPGILKELGHDVLLTYDGMTPSEALAVPAWHSQVLEPLELPTRYERLARVREAQRQYFLAGEWDYLYWHDSDMIPPIQIIDALLQHRAPIASGIYAERLSNAPKLVGMDARYSAGLMDASHFHCDQSVGYVDMFGMGCMLVRRDVLAATPFRDGGYAFKSWQGEDFRWCEDSGERILLDIFLSCWHVSENRTANYLRRCELRDACVWLGSSWRMVNSFGLWEAGLPRFDVDLAHLPTLGPEFVRVQCPRFELERMGIRDSAHAISLMGPRASALPPIQLTANSGGLRISRD